MADRGTFRVATPAFNLLKNPSWAGILAMLRPGPHFAATGFGQPVVRILPGDATLAFEMYAGRFSFAGETITATALEVFKTRRAPAAWQATLQSLSWLQHFAASQRKLHAHYAMRLLGRWAKAGKASQDVSSASKILLALVIDGQALAKSCDALVQREFLQLVTRQTRLLARSSPRNARAALLKAIALLHVVTAFQGMEALRKPAVDLFSAHIDKLILPDGGHISRNPYDVLVLLALLMPLKAAMKTARINFPASATNVIERMLPFLALVTHPDGGLARFFENDPETDGIKAIINADDTKAQSLVMARHSHYARLEYAKAVLLVDTQRGVDFEFSDGAQRLLSSSISATDAEGSARLHQSPQGSVLQINFPQTCTRTYFLSATGQDLRIEDHHSRAIEIRLQLEPGVKLSALREGTGIMLVTPDRDVWNLSWRGGEVHIEQNGAVIKIACLQGQRLNWAIKKQPKSAKPQARRRMAEPDLLG